VGAETFDIGTLDRRETEHAWLPAAFAHIGGSACLQAEKKAAGQLKSLGEFPPRLGQILWYETALLSEHRILGVLVTLGDIVRKMAVLPDPAGVILASHALIALVLSALRSASRLDFTPSTELRNEIETGLITGDPTDVQILRVLSVADAFFRAQADSLHQAYVEAGTERLPVPFQSARDHVAQPPLWIDRYIDLCERFRGNPMVARQLPQTLELSCFDALLGDGNWKAQAFDHLFTAEHRQLIAVTLDTFQQVVGNLALNVRPLLDIPFDRSPLPLPDRRTPFSSQTPA
jgi:hypothetical protein